MAERKPRFVLVDPSFDGARGDKWQYAVAFAQSALAAGYEFHLVSNESSPSIADVIGGISEHRLFRYAFYQHDQIVSRHDRSPLHAREKGRVAREARLLSRTEDVIRKAWERGDRGGVEAAERHLRRLKREAAQRSQEAELQMAVAQIQPFNRDDFADALAKLITDLELEKGDRLFFHTATPAMLESLTEVTLRLQLQAPLDVDAYFLFHFGAEASDARTFLDRYHSFSHYGSLISRLKSGSPFQRQYYLTTCPELSEECEALFGAPFGGFDGLANLAEMSRVLGGEISEERLGEERQGASLAGRPWRVGVRASDLTPAAVDAIREGVAIFKAQGMPLDVRVFYHTGSAPALREIAAKLSDDVRFIDTEENDGYIRALAESDVMLLTYSAEIYEKRVSAVLHDCAVLGVPCIVPDGSTLATSAAYADIEIYSHVREIPGMLLRMWRSRVDEEGAPVRAAKLAEARRLYSSDVVRRLVGAMETPSLTVTDIGPKAVVIMPAWGRCGSSLAMEAQVRYLLNRGYFVVQIFVLDKSAAAGDATQYLWTILHQNSQFTRGSIQRAVYATHEAVDALEADPDYLAASPFNQFLERISVAEIQDVDVEAFCRDARITVVNHVFHSRFAQRWCGGTKILETHDIQSYQMAAWPLRDADTGEPAGLAGLLHDEMAEMARYDHIINVAPEEHAVLSLQARASTMVIPYVQAGKVDPSVATIEQMADREGWGSWYSGMKRFPVMLVGDSHQANREAGEWFVTEVYKPYLQPKGIVVAVIGKLAGVLFERFEAEPGLMFTGFVKDLSTVRALSDVCVIPDRRGTGISIKALETFAEGAAFVATSTALRGLESGERNLLPRFDDPKAFADQIVHLLKDADARAFSRRQARAAYEAVSGEDRFNAIWDNILSDVTSSGAQTRVGYVDASA